MSPKSQRMERSSGWTQVFINQKTIQKFLLPLNFLIFCCVTTTHLYGLCWGFHVTCGETWKKRPKLIIRPDYHPETAQTGGDSIMLGLVVVA